MHVLAQVKSLLNSKDKADTKKQGAKASPEPQDYLRETQKDLLSLLEYVKSQS